MDNVMALAIYIFIWWIVLFAVLPFGVRTQDEAGSVVPGTPGQRAGQRAHLPHPRHQHGGGDGRLCARLCVDRLQTHHAGDVSLVTARANA